MEQTVSGGTITFNTYGATLTTTATGSRSASLKWVVGQGTGDDVALRSQSPLIGIMVGTSSITDSGTSSMFAGMGSVTVGGTGHTFTGDHVGFKVLRAVTTNSLYATQADGTTENASAALATLNSYDVLELIIKINSTTSADYYWRRNGGALSSATNLTTNLIDNNDARIQISTSNDSTAVTYAWNANGAFYER